MRSHSEESTTHPSLLLRVRDARNHHAWNEFVDVYGPVIFNYCRLRQLQECDASDVAQEVLLRLSSALREFEYKPELGRFRDWLGVVTHRELLKFWNRRGRSRSLTVSLAVTQNETSTTEVLDDSLWNAHFHSELLQAALVRIRSEFTEQTWEAFQLAWLEDQSPIQVAERLQIGIEKVYVAKSRALKRLREEVLRLSEDLPVANH
jgi:RNA polymerase sigma factor (sigma-70 family)